MAFLPAVMLGLTLVAPSAQGQDDAGNAKGGVIDEGVLVVSGRAGLARREEFSIFQRSNGGYTVRSTISADDGSYWATARWNYDAAWRALDAAGQGDVKGVKRRLEMWRETTPAGTMMRMSRRATDANGEPRNEIFSAPCDAECLIDMSPAALPMSVMTRRYDAAKGGQQTFRWVGMSLIDDQVLTDGTATIWREGPQDVAGGPVARVDHWRFVENLTNPESGQAYQMHMHLWTDETFGLRKFGVGRTPVPSTVGVRESDTGVSAQMTAE